MLSIIIGIVAGLALPMQTSVNTRLKRRVGTPFLASFISFLIAITFLMIVLLITGQSIAIPLGKIFQEPFWIWCGGIFGVIFLTGNIVLFPKLGGVQTVILPVMGQILMGLLIDNFGWFYSKQSPLTWMKVIGAILLIIGVVVVSTVKQLKIADSDIDIDIDIEKQEKKTDLIVWRVFGVLAGILSASQTAINGYLGRVVESPAKASVVSFVIGIIFLFIICAIMYIKNGKPTNIVLTNKPWWMWVGGFLGSIFIFTNIYLSSTIGTGMVVIVVLIGSTLGGLLIDQFSLFESPQKSITLRKIIGVLIMIIGAVCIRLL